MTIAAGFKVLGGVVLCADTEHSSGGIVTHDSKLIPVDFDHGRAIFSLSGSSTQLAKAAVQKCVAALRRTEKSEIQGHHDIAERVEEIIDIEYRKHVCANPDPQGDSVYQLLMAAWSPHDGPDGPGLYTTWQGTIHECDTYECIGSGFYLGRYLIESMFSPAMNVQAARIMATYAVAQAKARVDGCSGQTNIVTLHANGEIEGFSWEKTRELEDTFRSFNDKSWGLLFSLITQDDDKFNDQLFTFSDAMINLRTRLGLDQNARTLLDAFQGLAMQPGQSRLQSATADLLHQQPSLELPGGAGEP